MEKASREGGPILLIFMERLIGLILIILGIILLYETYSAWTGLGEILFTTFTAISIILILLGLIMILSKQWNYTNIP
ncbi:MAG: hypothetical protein QXR84_06075 [Candidatus Bathyarchaeia archaeon]|nr:hypothetical protein [Candidatus Bathyarchaeota archaeon]